MLYLLPSVLPVAAKSSRQTTIAEPLIMQRSMIRIALHWIVSMSTKRSAERSAMIESKQVRVQWTHLRDQI